MGPWISKVVSGFFFEQEDCKQYFAALSSAWDLKDWNIWIMKQGETLSWERQCNPYHIIFRNTGRLYFSVVVNLTFAISRNTLLCSDLNQWEKWTHDLFHSWRWRFLNVLKVQCKLICTYPFERHLLVE